MYVKVYERQLMDIAAYRLHKQLYVYASPVIIVVGVVGNLLSFVVLVQRPLRRVSTYCYLIVLAVADTLVLTAGLLPKWIHQVCTLATPRPLTRLSLNRDWEDFRRSTPAKLRAVVGQHAVKNGTQKILGV